MLFNLVNEKLSPLKETSFEKEKKLQEIIGKNLKSIFDIEFVAFEFPIKDVRFDILGFDTKSNSFVIIELKNKANFSVIDQGYAYLAQLLANKYEVSEAAKIKGFLNNKKPDWEQSKVIFISPEYTKYQVMLSISNNLPIELWEAKLYENKILSLEKIQTSVQFSTTKNTLIASNPVQEKIKVYTEDYHLKKLDDDTVKEAYLEIKDALISNDMTINVQKYYISFKKGINIAYLRNFTKKHFEIVIMLPAGRGKQLIKKHEIKLLSKGIQKFYGGPCFSVLIDKNNDLDEVIKTVKEATNW